ncbi:pyridoxal phosphate-dependent aminotransferase [Alicyclobacillus acidoterrestris]|uniref:Aminotransferase class I/II-fold pyridoxal phosphate-dependent enzyme n=1 Tax=Alicyclobacillus acidoterrestris (strain ATCC 49025 / DSM 3922 / CIP 106132 / NCIMB 13137 / GD3B) TaxID=1356854 RepID=T0D097_ALIAG|nr:aminotransferase class I/II-fold pyridoxal phosphate-dependent enzyme [Alicyclobacillus acidoterrestris]EPZ43216.1 hypothetical protein N007_13685 [Alicyclobacillus acidoterrestris ATCC 49025]UNO48526.1 aminotransferase class I/II-fold pyridoxal phosphate-dependent enzyme [Alicyclobacillus acidoterrestris]
MAHGGRVYEYAAASGVDVANIVDFSANINPLGPPASVLKAIETAMPRIVHYPDARHQAVKEILAQAHQVDVSALFCGNGATEVIELVFREVRPRRTFVLDPAFSEYADIAKRMGSQIERVPLKRTQITWDLPLDVLDTQLEDGDLVVINTPHNPTSTVWPWDTFRTRALNWCERGVTVVIDESFIDFLPQSSSLSAIADACMHPGLFVIRSATKIYAIPGLRFGFGIGHRDFVRGIEGNRDGWSVNALAQAAACAAYCDEQFLQETHTWLASEHDYLRQTWGADERLVWHAPNVNFFIASFAMPHVREHVQDALRKRGILSRACDDFHGLDSTYVRFAIRSHQDNQLLWTSVVAALDAIPCESL